jgi:plasmid stabilization system protein ParE
MSAPVVILSGAEADVQRIYNRLTDYRDGAGDEFLDRLDSIVRLLESFPELGRPRQLGFRRILVPGHVYGVYYQIEAREVMVHAVADLRQDPAWLDKLLRERLE